MCKVKRCNQFREYMKRKNNIDCLKILKLITKAVQELKTEGLAIAE